MSKKARKPNNTVTVDRDAMLALLSTAYRACRQLRQIAGAALAPTYGGVSLDLSWLYETAAELDRQGHCAMIDAAELIGIDDESLLAGFAHPDDVDVDAEAAVAAGRVARSVPA